MVVTHQQNIELFKIPGKDEESINFRRKDKQKRISYQLISISSDSNLNFPGPTPIQQ